jgi:acyl-CoA synthetase (AMP-forming)/AMP-acid ligase II
MAAEAHGDRLAIGRRTDGITYAQLLADTRAGADQLEEQTDVVIFIGQSGPAFATGFFASAWRGVPFVPLNYRLGAEPLRALLDRHPDATVIADARYVDELPSAGPRRFTSADWLAAIRIADAGPPRDIAEVDQPALYLYTSGTSSVPKAAVLHHRHLASYILGSVEFASAAETDAALVSVPPYHIAGVANLLSNVFAGRRVVYLPTFTPEAWLDAVRVEGVTQAMVVPTMLARLVEAIEPDEVLDGSTLRLISYGGARIHDSVLRKALTVFPGVGFVNAYGLTETSSSIAVLGPDEHRDAVSSADPNVQRRLASVGTPLPGVEVQVRDPEGVPLSPGTVGDIWVRGEQVSGEYAGLGSTCDRDGWFPTRDAGHVDDEGYLFIDGRVDDTIIRGGENIAPAEVEDVLLRHPAVLDAAVVGLPDTEWGQVVAAAVTLRVGASATVEELRDWTRHHLRSSRAADIVVFRDELPRTDTGKLLRRHVLDDLRSLSDVG